MSNPAHGSGAKRGTGKGTLLAWRKNGRTNEMLSYFNVDSLAIANAVRAVTHAGAAIMFGTTSDGGAFSICILDNQDKLKEYPNSVEQCEAMLEAIAAHYGPA